MGFFEEVNEFNKKIDLNQKYITDLSSQKRGVSYINTNTLLVSEEEIFKPMPKRSL